MPSSSSSSTQSRADAVPVAPILITLTLLSEASADEDETMIGEYWAEKEEELDEKAKDGRALNEAEGRLDSVEEREKERLEERGVRTLPRCNDTAEVARIDRCTVPERRAHVTTPRNMMAGVDGVSNPRCQVNGFN